MTSFDTSLDTFFDNPPDRRYGDSLKWNKYAQEYPDAIGAWVADMDFALPPPIAAALQQRVAGPALGYCDPDPELLPLFLERLQRLYNWQVDPEWVVTLAGIVPGLFGAVRASGKAGGSVITQSPTYPRFFSAAEYSDRELLKLQSIPTQRDGSTQWEIDFDQFELLARQRPSTLLLCNPHNPVGRVYTADELQRVADICLAHDIVICSDEVHCDLVLDEDKSHSPIASLSPEIAARSITLMGPGKAFNLAGVLGFGFAIIPDAALRERFERHIFGISGHPTGIAYHATLAAYRDCDDWLTALVEYLRGNRTFLATEIAKLPTLSMAPVEATFLAWLDVRALHLENPHQHFLNHGVALSDGADMGMPGYLRLNFGCARSTLEEMVQRIKIAVSHP